MKVFLASLAATIGISVIAWYGLDMVGFSSEQVSSGSSVRLD